MDTGAALFTGMALRSPHRHLPGRSGARKGRGCIAPTVRDTLCALIRPETVNEPMKNMMLAAVALALVVALALPASAQQAAPPAPGQPDQVDQLAEALGLSEEQQDEIRGIIDELGPQIESLQQETQQVQMELRQHVGHDYDEQAIREGADRLGDLTGEMTALSLLLQSRVQEVFTEEQREELEMQAQRQREMEEQFHQQQQQQPQQQW